MKVVALDGHPRDEELADYVSNMLDDADAERLEDHVFECPACEARLQEAASFQMVLHEAADAHEHQRVAPPPSRLRRIGRRVGAVGGLWAAAAALALVILRPASNETVPVVTIADDPGAVSDDLRWSTCDPDDPSCAPTLLASVDPLESIDPLSSWPDDPLVRAGFGDAEGPEGEPCGSGEDGGPLVCPTNDEPFSG